MSKKFTVPVKDDKCEFHTLSVIFFSCIMARGRLDMADAKVETLRYWQISEKQKMFN